MELMDKLSLEKCVQNSDHYTLSQMRFPHKLLYLVSSGSGAIIWGGQGCTLLFNSYVLDSYLRSDASIFKTRNLSSFIRQLNLYGFHKVTSHEQDLMCNASNPHLQEYAHYSFLRHRPDLVTNITRKAFSSKDIIKFRGTPSNWAKEPGVTSALERARGALRAALHAAARRYGYHPTSPPPPPPLAPPVLAQYCFAEAEEHEAPVLLDLELASRPLHLPPPPHSLVLHIALPRHPEIPAPHKLDEKLKLTEEHSDQNYCMVPLQELEAIDYSSVMCERVESSETVSCDYTLPASGYTSAALFQHCVESSETVSCDYTLPATDYTNAALFQHPSDLFTSGEASGLDQLSLHISSAVELLNCGPGSM